MSSAEISLKASEIDPSLFGYAKKTRSFRTNSREDAHRSNSYKKIGRERTTFGTPEMEIMLRVAAAIPDMAAGARI